MKKSAKTKQPETRPAPRNPVEDANQEYAATPSAARANATAASPRWRRAASAIAEPFGFVLLIFVYIWVIEPRNSVAARIVSLVILASIPPVSQRLRRENPRNLGFRLDNLGRSAREVGIFTLAAAGLLIAAAFLAGKGPALPQGMPLALLTYPLWAFLQQYALQAFLHRRLLRVCRSTQTAAGISALVFASLHYPNPVLVPVTALGGYAWCRLYQRTPNLFSLAVSHGWLAMLLLAVSPDAWVHNLRVGPGYWAYPP